MQSFESPLTIVTASCHNIKLLRALDPMKSLHMEGVVSWVGRSSMWVMLQIVLKWREFREIKISVFSVDNESKQLSIEALFNMVARDKQNKAVPVVPLRPETEEEILLYKQGEGTYFLYCRVHHRIYLLLLKKMHEGEKQNLHFLWRTNLQLMKSDRSFMISIYPQR
jgi:acyl-CoA hydrolase